MIHETCGRLPSRTSAAKAAGKLGTVAIPFCHSGELCGACWNCSNHARGLSSPVSGSW
jgi:hypothetical protein